MGGQIQISWGAHIGSEWSSESFSTLKSLILKQAEKILSSALTDWQKVEVL